MGCGPGRSGRRSGFGRRVEAKSGKIHHLGGWAVGRCKKTTREISLRREGQGYGVIGGPLPKLSQPGRTKTSPTPGKHLLLIRLPLRLRFSLQHLPSTRADPIVEYVTCKICKSPDTLLSKENRLDFVQCETCGSSKSSYSTSLSIPSYHQISAASLLLYDGLGLIGRTLGLCYQGWLPGADWQADQGGLSGDRRMWPNGTLALWQKWRLGWRTGKGADGYRCFATLV